jgi:hypothetical protein
MTVAILVLLVCLILVSFKTVRMIIGIFVFLGILGYLYGPKESTHAQVPQTTITEPTKSESAKPAPAPSPAPLQKVMLPDAILGDWCVTSQFSIDPNINPPVVAVRMLPAHCPGYDLRWHRYTEDTEVVGDGWLRCKAQSVMTISDEYIVKWDCTEIRGGRAYKSQHTNKLRIEQGKLITTHVAAPKE